MDGLSYDVGLINANIIQDEGQHAVWAEMWLPTIYQPSGYTNSIGHPHNIMVDFDGVDIDMYTFIIPGGNGKTVRLFPKERVLIQKCIRDSYNKALLFVICWYETRNNTYLKNTKYPRLWLVPRGIIKMIFDYVNVPPYLNGNIKCSQARMQWDNLLANQPYFDNLMRRKTSAMILNIELMKVKRREDKHRNYQNKKERKSECKYVNKRIQKHHCTKNLRCRKGKY